MDPKTIARLKQSIEDDGSWGGVVCRKLPDGTLQIAAGHHRVMAALEVGITEADLFVAEDMDDAAMIRVYARENATQRGVSSTALAGTVAAAMRYVAKAILKGSAEKFLSSFHLPTLRERLLLEDGLGRDVLFAFLSDIPGINTANIQHQLANLKYSGDYARLIAEVQQEIAAEKAAAEAQELARKAAEAAARKYVAKCLLTGTGFAGEFTSKIDMRYARSRLLSRVLLQAKTALRRMLVPLCWRLSTVSRMSARTWSSSVSTASANSPSAEIVEGATPYSLARRSRAIGVRFSDPASCSPCPPSGRFSRL
jgi:ParB-like chromosome segregation protein Spo0J